MSNTNQSRLPFLSALAISAASLLFACQQDETIDDEIAAADPSTPRAGELPCISYCEAREGQLLERCEQEGNEAETCASVVATHISACIQRQCGLNVVLPEAPELEDLARQIGHSLLGPEYEITNVIPRHWDPETIGSRAYIFTSGIDQSRAFVEMGASLEQPPVVSYGLGEIADAAMHEHAVSRLSEFYGEQDYQLGRRYFTAMHPILEYTTGQGSFFYDVTTNDVSDEFDIQDNPDVDQEAMAIRRESFERQWDRYLAGEFE